MARRMFNTEIVDSDAFLEMPISSQAFYFHLGMQADDDGFVGNPKKIMRIVGVSEDDLKLLIAKRFILSFKSGVVVIKHWLNHNKIRADLYQETNYKNEKSLLGLNENGAYTELREGVSEIKKIEAPDWLKRRRGETVSLRTANGTQSAHRIGKDSIGKNILDNKLSNKKQASGKSKTFGNPLLNEGIILLEELYPKFTNRQLNRYALNRLIKIKGSQRVFKAIRYAKDIKSLEYAPQINNYITLEKKWSQLEDFARRQKPTKNSGFSEGFKIIKA